MNKERAREVAHRILEEFEDLLTEYGIMIPSADRTGAQDEAHLFGMEHSRLEEAVVEILLEESPVLETADPAAGDDWPVREVAIRIVDAFEDLLADKDIMVPSADRRGGPEEACLYGSEYYALEDGVVGILMDEFGGKAEGGATPQVDEEAKLACERMQQCAAGLVNAAIGGRNEAITRARPRANPRRWHAEAVREYRLKDPRLRFL